ncbi:MAG: cysteine hydrolase [Mariprofundales bacterium]|nr:cysteine hydrolase [Mariprofundales bacterium]
MQANTTALVLIGYQNDYFSQTGILRSVIESDADRVLSNTLKTVQALASSATTIISTPILFTDDYRELNDPVGILKTIKEVGAFKHGSEGGKTNPELAAFGERIIEIPGKRGLNAFANTQLEQTLKAHNIEDVVLAGVVTAICIDSTGRAAHERGFRVHVLSDTTGGRTGFEQDFYCREIFPLYAEVLPCDAIIAALSEPLGEQS